MFPRPGPPAVPDDVRHFEFREVEIPLGVRSCHCPGTGGIAHVCERVIGEQLERLEADGWWADGPTDLASLWDAGRVRFVGQRLTSTYAIESARVRVRREVLAAAR